MRTDLTRKDFLIIGLGAVAASAFDCAADDTTAPAGGSGSPGSAGTNNGSAGSSTGNSGANVSSGGSAGSSSNAGSGGDTSAGGSAGSGGSGNVGGSSGGAGSGASGAGGGGGGNSCAAQISTMSSMSGTGNMVHQHRMIIPLADLTAGVTKSFQTDVSAGAPGCNHCHQVELTAADITMLKAGGVVKKQTCNGGDHEFVFSCAANPPAPVAPTAARCPNGDANMEGACMPAPARCP